MMPDDDHLVSFLRRNRPVPSPASAEQEKQLLALIVSQPPSPKRYLWTIPGAIAAVLLSWGGYRLFVPSLQKAQATQLETFLVNSWDGSIEGSDSDRADSPETDWLLLANP